MKTLNDLKSSKKNLIDDILDNTSLSEDKKKEKKISSIITAGELKLTTIYLNKNYKDIIFHFFKRKGINFSQALREIMRNFIEKEIEKDELQEILTEINDKK